MDQESKLTDYDSTHYEREYRKTDRVFRREKVESNRQPDNHLIDEMNWFAEDPWNEIESLVAWHTVNEEKRCESLDHIESNENRYQRNSHMTHEVDVFVSPVGWIFAVCDVQFLKL